MNRFYKRYSGFTLIELLAAMSIFAVLSVLAFVSLHQVIINQSIIDKNITEFQQVQTVMQLMQRDFSQITQRPVYTNLYRREPAFVESNKNEQLLIEFTRGGFSNPNYIFNRSSLQRVAYIYRNKQFIRKIWPNIDANHTSQPEERVLLQNVEQLNWTFFDIANKPHIIWPPISSLRFETPKAVKIEFEISTIGDITRIFELPQRITTTKR